MKCMKKNAYNPEEVACVKFNALEEPVYVKQTVLGLRCSEDEDQRAEESCESRCSSAETSMFYNEYVGIVKVFYKVAMENF